MKPVIYTQRVEVIADYQERRDCADQRIADFIHACGFMPIPLPNRAALAKDIVSRIHPQGIVLTGGNSLTAYGGNAPERDEMDHALITLAIENNIPLYGFCRGMQSILFYFGNVLEAVEGHVAVHHFIREGLENVRVNSYHNQGCKEIKKDCGLVIVAQAEDGVIEAVYHEKHLIVGTMWHPEREYPFRDVDVERVRSIFEKGRI